MEHLLLGGVPSGDELHVVHKKHVGAPVFLPEFLVASLPDGLDQLIGEGVPLDIDNAVGGKVFVHRVGDGVEQVGFAQTGFPIDEQGIIAFAGGVSHRPGGGMGKLVGGAHYKAFKRIILCPRQKAIPCRLLGKGIGLLLSQYHYIKIGGKKLPQSLLYVGKVAFADNIPLKGLWGTQEKAVVFQRNGPHVVKPGVNGGRGHLLLQQGEHLFPYCGGRIHSDSSFVHVISDQTIIPFFWYFRNGFSGTHYKI